MTTPTLALTYTKYPRLEVCSECRRLFSLKPGTLIAAVDGRYICPRCEPPRARELREKMNTDNAQVPMPQVLPPYGSFQRKGCSPCQASWVCTIGATANSAL